MLKFILIFLFIFAGIHSCAFADTFKLRNFCTNGGYEKLSPQGLPLGWNGFAAMGASFGVSKEARSGDHALSLKSTSNAVVGVNRNRDELMPLVRGVALFWYKAISSDVDGKNLQVCIIAMNESGQQEVGRKIYTVPSEHVGDGKWHSAEVEFDFTLREDAKKIHFAPRINETSSEKAAGEFLLDDIEVTMIGPKLRIEKFGAAKPLIKTGEITSVRLAVRNVGDQDAVNIEGKLSLPEGIATDADSVQTFKIDNLKPDQSKELGWSIKGEQPVSGTIEAAVGTSLLSAVYLTVADQTKPEIQIVNKHLRLQFIKTKHGYGIFSLSQRQEADPAILAQTSMFSSVIYRSSDGAIQRVPLFADDHEESEGKFIFKKQFTDVDGVVWDFQFIFDLPPNQKWADVTYRLTADKPRELLAFYGPVLHTSRHNRYDAVFPGLEYLEGDEASSSTLDIAPPNNIRRVPHPNKVTIPLMAVSEKTGDGTAIAGMMWNAQQKWSQNSDRPSALFASPNWFECMDDYDAMGLFVPSIPDWVEENQTQASTPYNLQPGESIEITAQLFSISGKKPDISAIHAIPCWIEKYGLREPLPPPRGTLEKEMEFGLTAYMKTLWVSEEGAWHNTLDWDPWGIRVDAEFARQLWFTSKILIGAPEKGEYMKRAEFAFGKLGRRVGREAPFYIGDLDIIFPGIKGVISRLIQTQREDGSWRFDPDQRNAADTLHHQDYHKLGNEGDVEVGLCAQRAYNLLRYSSMTGDRYSLEAGLKALDFMRRFRIPRAAQVWEIPVHTPDVLASAHATQAYLEAYKITLDRSYLDTAIYWARTGLPFVYLWGNDDMPYMLYASIPVFGATWFTGSWFGVAVQWNGLDYAYALFDLADYDDSLPWGKIAQGLTVNGLYQQETSEKYKGLYPDSYNFMDKTTSAWKLAPGQIVRNLFLMMGYPAEPVTVIVRDNGRNVRINAAVPAEETRLSATEMSFSLKYPPAMDGYVMIAGLGKPDGEGVTKNQQIVKETDELASVAEGWKHNEQNGFLFMKLKRDSDRMDIVISEPEFSYVPQLSQPAKEIDWQFDKGGLRDWTAENDLTPLRIEDGSLVTRSTGSDPYMVSAPAEIDASRYSRLIIRMKTSKGRHAQVFWSTESDPISEATSISFEIKSDGEFHDYAVNLSQHNKWKGTITSLRLDPADSAGSEIAVRSIAGK